MEIIKIYDTTKLQTIKDVYAELAKAQRKNKDIARAGGKMNKHIREKSMNVVKLKDKLRYLHHTINNIKFDMLTSDSGKHFLEDELNRDHNYFSSIFLKKELVKYIAYIDDLASKDVAVVTINDLKVGTKFYADKKLATEEIPFLHVVAVDEIVVEITDDNIVFNGTPVLTIEHKDGLIEVTGEIAFGSN